MLRPADAERCIARLAPLGDDEARLSGARAEFVAACPDGSMRSGRRFAPLRRSRPTRTAPMGFFAGCTPSERPLACSASRVSPRRSVKRKIGSRRRPAPAVRRPLDEVARALNLLPSLVLGAPASMRDDESRERAPLPRLANQRARLRRSRARRGAWRRGRRHAHRAGGHRRPRARARARTRGRPQRRDRGCGPARSARARRGARARSAGRARARRRRRHVQSARGRGCVRRARGGAGAS